MKRIYAVATLDSKGHEMAFLAACAREAGATVVVVDVGVKDPPVVRPDISRDLVASHHPKGRDWVFSQGEKSATLTAMGESLTHFLTRELNGGNVAGVVGMGGSEGSSLIAPALQSLPVGIPKLLVSTLACGDVSPYVGMIDLTLVYPVVDLAGLNRVSRPVLRNAGFAMAGMVRGVVGATGSASGESLQPPAAGMTMFGVTTPCVDAVREGLKNLGWESLAFHAVGSGGKAFESYAERGWVQGVLDITTTEIADELVGGIFKGGPDRLGYLTRHPLPAVVSVGALDMVNFGTWESVPEKFHARKFIRHTPLITLMRTNAEENRAIARFMAEKLNRAAGPLAVVIPERGVSEMDAPGMPFHDPAADAALFAELESHFKTGPRRRWVRLPLHINDPEFASTLVRIFGETLALSAVGGN